MDSRSGNLSKTDQLLQAAFIELAREMGDGKGMAETLSNAKDSGGRGVIHAAAEKGRTNICKYLIEELKFDVDEKDGEDCSPLLRATFEGRVRTVVYLIECGANPATLNRHNATALHIAASEGTIEIIHLLLSKGIDVNAPSDLGTPLQFAAQVCKQDVLKVLLDHSANPNLAVSLIPTPLLWSMIGNSLPCTKLLIQAGADPNDVSIGSSPLFLAAKMGQFDFIKCLLEAGADPDITDDTGMKPIEIAARNANLAEVGILFPVTSPIPACSDWSINGILEYVHSEEGRQQVLAKIKERLFIAKSEADRALHGKEYIQAKFLYTEVIALDPTDTTALSNRSFCFACQGYPELALEDALTCIKFRPDWPEAYYRAGVALTSLEKFDMAADALLMGLKLDRENKELQDAFQKAVAGKMNSVRI